MCKHGHTGKDNRETIMNIAVFKLILSCLPVLCLAITRPSSIKLENNEYTGLVIGIHPDIPEDEQLITRIQEMMTSASDYLYTATRQRAYFKNVTIVLPETWANSDLYESPGNSTFEHADVIIAPSNPRFSPIPYTKHFEACGKQAAYIHFTDSFLLDSMTELYYGPLGPLFVHEWGHFRWGILNEYADTVADRSNYEYHYRSPTTGLYEATRCSLGLKGLHLKLDTASSRYTYCSGDSTNGYEEGCVFIPTDDQDPELVSGSVMFGYTSLSEIIDFCDNETTDAKNYHNVEAPNKLNRICGLKSSWEVMREHSDFKDDNNPPRVISNRQPTFRITRVLPRRVVVVMDTSISMLNDDRNYKQASAVAHYISATILDGTSLGLISFSTKARIDSEMSLIASDTDREEMLTVINQNEPSGGTCIQCGLEEALKILQNAGTTDGAIILLITDGDETVGNLMEAAKDIISANVVVDAVAFSEDADSKLSYLASQTGGAFYLQTDDVGSSGIYQGLGGTMKRGVTEAQQRVDLESTSYLIQASANYTGQASVDETIGDRTSFFFSWNKDTGNILVDVTITSPSGIEYGPGSLEYVENALFRYVMINLQESAEVGTWTYSITNRYSESMEVVVNIASYPQSNKEDPIVVTSYLSGSTSNAADGEDLIAFAEVRQGYNPIIDANVIAIIERPPDSQGNSYEPVHLQLFDNGAGADLTEDDGIYSRFFTEYSNKGFYGVKIQVDGNNGEATILRQTTVPFEAAQIVIDPNNLDNLVIPEIGGVQALLPGMPPPALEGVPAPEFSRAGNGQSVSVSELPEGYNPTIDSTPPSTILNLRVVATSYEESRLTLEWTAPGDDLDSGKAVRYDIRRADTVQGLLGNFESGTPIEPSDVVNGVLTDPLSFGMKEKFVISVPVQTYAMSYSYAFAIKSIDDMEQVSEMSNVVIATFADVIPTPGPVESTEEPASSLEAWMIALIVAACLLLLIVLYLGVATFCFSKKRSDVKSQQHSFNDIEDNNWENPSHR
ncbi:calcium-activated chloride channel regulator 1-like isoform X3 [Apostichopus japonicus]|uniref:calcium-activated chloride channel regulator 1-like isoform X3 n=1 Tax=Stichopus japonicus TaxID=307972 RepID=UPI003AB5837B